MFVRILKQQVTICAVLMEGRQKLKDLSLESQKILFLEELAVILGPFKEMVYGIYAVRKIMRSILEDSRLICGRFTVNI